MSIDIRSVSKMDEMSNKEKSFPRVNAPSAHRPQHPTSRIISLTSKLAVKGDSCKLHCAEMFQSKGTVLISNKKSYCKMSRPRSRKIHIQNCAMALKFDKHLGSHRACQMAKRCDNLKCRYRGFGISRDLTIRRIFGYWNRAQISLHLFLDCRIISDLKFPTCPTMWYSLCCVWRHGLSAMGLLTDT